MADERTARTEKIRRRLAHERDVLIERTETCEGARARSEAATPGGLTDYDPAVLSGLTRSRRVAQKSAERRFDAYDKEADAYRSLTEQQNLVASLEWQLERAQADEKAPRDLGSLRPGSLVRTRHGWYRVIRVNRKSVSVETEFSWTERIPLAQIVETHNLKEER